MKKHLIFLSLLTVGLSSFGQTLKPVANNKGLMGYQNEAGAIVIKPTYDYAEPFNASGLAKVGKKDTYGIIRQDGTFALPMKYTSIDPLVDSHAVRIQNDDKYGLIDGKTGALLLKPTYTYISDYNCYGLAWFASGGKVVANNGQSEVQNAKIGILDTAGNIVLAPQYKGVYEFSQKTAEETQAIYGDSRLLDPVSYALSDTLKTDCLYLGIAKEEGTTDGAGLIDRHGNVILKAGKHNTIAYPQNNIMRYWDEAKKSITYGYFDLSTGLEFGKKKLHTVVDEMQYTTHIDFMEQVALQQDDTEHSSIINRSGQPIVSGLTNTDYCHLNEKDGYICGVKDQKYYVYDGQGQQILSDLNITDLVLPIPDKSDEVAFCVQIDGKYGVVDRDGNFLIEPQYDVIMANRYGLYPIKSEGQWGYVDNKNQVKVPAQYIGLVFPSDADSKSVWAQRADSLYYCYNIHEGKQYADGFTSVTRFVDGKAWAQPSQSVDKKGILYSEDGQIFVDYPFSTDILTQVKEAVKNAQKPLTKGQSKGVILRITQNDMHHKLAGVLSEDEWDY
jgi:hypothetical protein